MAIKRKTTSATAGVTTKAKTKARPKPTPRKRRAAAFLAAETLSATSVASFSVELSLRSSSASAATVGRVGSGARTIATNLALGTATRSLSSGSYWYRFTVQGTKAFSLGVSINGGARGQVQTYPADTITDTYAFQVP